MQHDNLKSIQKEWHGSLKSYLIGFISSLILTSLSFYLAAFKPISVSYLPYILMGLAIVQTIVQLIFFLHLGQEDKPKWESLTFGFSVLILVIILIGSLWIMHDLNYRVMSNM